MMAHYVRTLPEVTTSVWDGVNPNPHVTVDNIGWANMGYEPENECPICGNLYGAHGLVWVPEEERETLAGSGQMVCPGDTIGVMSTGQVRLFTVEELARDWEPVI
jgi:hypothetical protein